MQTIGDGQTVRLIETVRLTFRKSNFRSYGTFNRVIWEKFQTVRLIQTVRIIESTEYQYYTAFKDGKSFQSCLSN